MSPAGFPRLPGAQSDQRLLALAREGDERAFETFVRRYRRALLRYCRRMGLSESRADDVVQQALLRAWLALERGAEVHAPKAWLYRTVHNTAVNVLRSARDDRPLGGSAAVELAPSADSDFERRHAVRETLSDVAGLPRMQRDAIVLTAFAGRSHEEIALTLGVTHGAVRGLLYRARSTLRDAAAAVVPQPLLLWASGLLARMTPSAAKLAEVSAPGGGADFGGVGGVLTKGAALAATAAALAVGTGVVPLPRHLAHRTNAAAQALGIAPASADAQTGASPVAPIGTARARELAASDALSVHSPRMGTDGRAVRAAAERTAPRSRRRPHDGSGDGSGDGSASGSTDVASRRGGGEDLSGGPGRTAPRSASGTEGPQEPSVSSAATGGGRSMPECDSCPGAPGGDREPGVAAAGDAVAPSSSGASAGDSRPSPPGSGEALAEQGRRD